MGEDIVDAGRFTLETLPQVADGIAAVALEVVFRPGTDDGLVLEHLVEKFAAVDHVLADIAEEEKEGHRLFLAVFPVPAIQFLGMGQCLLRRVDGDPPHRPLDIDIEVGGGVEKIGGDPLVVRYVGHLLPVEVRDVEIVAGGMTAPSPSSKTAAISVRPAWPCRKAMIFFAVAASYPLMSPWLRLRWSHPAKGICRRDGPVEACWRIADSVTSSASMPPNSRCRKANARAAPAN